MQVPEMQKGLSCGQEPQVPPQPSLPHSFCWASQLGRQQFSWKQTSLSLAQQLSPQPRMVQVHSSNSQMELAGQGLESPMM
jgi:hypothetical protein